MAIALSFGACVAAMVTWFHVAFRLLDIADEPAFCQRRRSRWLLVALAATADGVVICTLVLGCVSVYTEMSRDSDRPITCTNDELGGCMPTVDRTGPATPQTVHAIYVAAAIALIGLAVLLVCSHLRARTPPAGWKTPSPHSRTEPAPDSETQSGSAPTLLDHHHDRNPSHG